MVEFYKQALAQATLEKTEEATVLTWKFPGAELGEEIEVTARPGLIHISECLKAGKHKRD